MNRWTLFSTRKIKHWLYEKTNRHLVNRMMLYRNQSKVDNTVNNATINANGIKNGVNAPATKEQEQVKKLLDAIAQNPSATQAHYAEQIGVSKRTVSRIFASLQEKDVLRQTGTKRKSNWIIKN